MNIVKTNFLTADQTDAVLNLQKIVSEFDKTQDKVWLSNEINIDKNMPSFFMAYEHNTLAGFLTVFMPGKLLPEITAFTRPDYRQKGVFTKLLNEANEILRGYGVKEILFVVNNDSESGKLVIEKKQNTYSHTEARMVCDAAQKFQSALTFVPCAKNNVKVFAKIQMAVFNDKKSDYDFSDSLLNNPDREGYIAYLDKTAIGAFGLYFDKAADEVFLYGVGVMERYRGRGYGKQMLMFAQNIGLRRQSKVVLDVNVQNDTALNLYLKAGFSPIYKMNYFKHKI
ncbi:MAG TPA: GNAT family N-acetyltransferase [Eubacteriales bacterium]|nr:GNAT family N-acetyltransferase [Eubacteriales bacterium]